ncbi:MAG: PHP domain-containing protein [Clostridia bacterium]|nr:PHP domain-containing protein [Clostridia bacterium]
MYKYELHLHTKEASACARASGAEMVDFYIQNGYQGMVVTDHFYHGNTAIDRDLPWEDFITEYCRGYESAKKAAEGRDFDVFFGIEEKFEFWDEYLVLGITPDFLRAHPELRDMRGKNFFEFMHASGAFIIQAHPYRERPYMRAQTVMLRPNDVDAIEAYNCCNAPDCNRRGYEYAKSTGLPMTGGSDRHTADGDYFSGVAVPFRCHTVEALIEAIKARKAEVINLQEAIKPELCEPNFTVKVSE